MQWQSYATPLFLIVGHRKLYHEHLTDFCLRLADLDTKWTAHSECLLLHSTPTTLIQATKKLPELLYSPSSLPILLVCVRHSKKSHYSHAYKSSSGCPLPLSPLCCSHTCPSIPFHYICGLISIINALIYLIAYLPSLLYNSPVQLRTKVHRDLKQCHNGLVNHSFMGYKHRV